MMNEKVKQALESILQRFKNGDIPEAIALSSFPISDIPAARWSLFNRTLMVLAGTRDARGIKQWNRVRRSVKKGSKSFPILAPHFVTRVTEDNEKEKTLAGFLAVPVFRVEDTEGEPLDYETLELPELPLIEVAQRWNISVKAIPGNYCFTGYFCQEQKEIALATREESVFFHELAHYADFLIMPR